MPEKYYDLVILDPPRKGCDKRVLKAITKDGIPEIIYVSCSPPTMGRDLKILSRMGYNVKKVQPVDMFPQTPHVECAAFLEHSRA